MPKSHFLYIDGCPELTIVFSSSWLPQTLKGLRVKFCDKNVFLFEAECELPNLDTMHLWELPELKSIGISFPSLEALKIPGATSLIKSLHWCLMIMYLETLFLENYPLLEHFICFDLLLARLKYVVIKSCQELQTLFIHSNSIGWLQIAIFQNSATGGTSNGEKHRRYFTISRRDMYD
ncbi:disease resistance protein [Tanacetum coccineum]|uniref:Disease resistance protein n=1 Tax=Tanacetum coccineum TaxID=301880 RepID=A0ABQ4Y048_9ASTR